MKNILQSISLLFCIVILTTQVYAQGSSISVNTDEGSTKSVSKARNISLVNTFSSLGAGIGTVAITENNTLETSGAMLAVYGLVAGPSTGNFYAKDFRRGFIGLAARTTGAILMVDATREIFGNDFADALTVDDKEVSLTDTKILIGELLVLGSIAYNIITVQKSVTEYNQSTISLGFNSTTVNRKVAPMLTAKVQL
ncbi:hypothetical protein [Fodinibius salinus]|nr:hypothetical protein [Fodinibius salinus]